MQEELGIQLADCSGIGKGNYFVSSASKTRMCCHCSHKPGCWDYNGEGDGHGLSLAELRV